jgi:hypothetical protein
MNSNLLNQFQLLYQQHQLAQLNALKSKQTQNFKANQEMNNKLMNSICKGLTFLKTKLLME